MSFFKNLISACFVTSKTSNNEKHHSYKPHEFCLTIESLTLPVYVVDRSGSIINANKAAAELFLPDEINVDGEAIHGMEVWRLLFSDDLSKWNMLVSQLLKVRNMVVKLQFGIARSSRDHDSFAKERNSSCNNLVNKALDVLHEENVNTNNKKFSGQWFNVHITLNATEDSLTFLHYSVDDYIKTGMLLRELAENQANWLRMVYPAHITEVMMSKHTVNKTDDLLSLVLDHECVHILFADIVGFTEMCKAVPARTVMRFLNSLYGIFDDLTDSTRV